MSMYIGKVGTTPVIHATKTTTDLSTIATTTRITDTSFHSGDTLIHTVNTGNYTASDFIAEYPTGTTHSYQQATLASTSLDNSHGWLVFARLGSGDYTLLGNVIFAIDQEALYKMVDYSETLILTSKTVGSVTTVQVSHYLGLGTISSTTANKLTVEVYDINQFSLPNSGEILIGNGQFIVGGVSLENKAFLNTSVVNAVDKTFPPYNYQILNSTYQLSNSELGINRFSIGSTYNGIFYPIFGDEVNCTSTLINTTTYSTYTTNPSFVVSNTTDPLVIITDISTYDSNIDSIVNPHSLIIPVQDIFDGTTILWGLIDDMDIYYGYRLWAEVVLYDALTKTFSIKLRSHTRIYDEINGSSNYYHDLDFSCIGYEYN